MKLSHEDLEKNSSRLKTEFLQIAFTKKVLITYSLENSTARAIRNCKTFKPISLFRVWADNFLSDPKTIKLLKSRTDFKSFRTSTKDSLSTFWKLKDKRKLPVHLSNKLTDLFLKFLPLWTEIDVDTKEWIFNNANVPLDKHSLTYLSEHNPGLGISKNPSMGHIDSDKKYDKMQSAIKDICKDIPVMIFDLLAWEEGHKSFELQKLDPKKQAKSFAD